MRKKIKRYFFYIVSTSILFLNNLFVPANAAIDMTKRIHTAYGPPPMQGGAEQVLLRYFHNFIWLIYVLVIPIIFFIGLYFFLTKKADEKRKEKGLKYMKWALIIFVITFLLATSVEKLVRLYFG